MTGTDIATGTRSEFGPDIGPKPYAEVIRNDLKFDLNSDRSCLDNLSKLKLLYTWCNLFIFAVIA